jgi:hypothetical protein
MQARIEESDVRPIAERHNAKEPLLAALCQLRDSELLYWLAQYIHFNSVFAGGVANLAGEIAYRQDLFRDASEQSELIADQSVEVASHIFFAAVDEFGRRNSHRSMAKETLRGVARYYGCATEDISVAGATTVAINNVAQGYCLTGPWQL